MIADIITQLKTDAEYWHSRVYEGYPPQFNVLPVVSVYQTAQNDIAVGDGKGIQFYKYQISIDIWTKDRAEAMKDKALTLLYAMNKFVKLDSANILQESGGIKHINLTMEVK